ncbi:MAG: translocation/assembly module TamB, partial [Candidatus Cloacimonetes bacterium]|nr:translocation/assembly module TamB [Candidatus Cloacimonadota bacterium]
NRTALAVSLVGADDLSLNIEGNIEDLNEMKGLSLKGSFDNIDLSLIDPLRDINSDLNFNLIFQATDLNNIDNAEIVFSNSTIDGLDLKELELKAKYIAENIDIETFKLNLEGNTFETSGSYGQTNDLIYKLSLHNLSPIFDYFLPELNLLPPTVELNGKVAGEIDNLITNGKLNITDIKYEDITAQGLSIDYDLSLQDWAINTVSANVVVDSTTLNSIAIDKIGVNGKLAEDTVQLTIRVDQDTDNYGTLSSTIDLKDDIVVYPLELDINVGELHFTLEDGDIKYGTNKLEINSFVLTDGSQVLSLLGFVSPNEEIGMELNISNLDLTTPSLFIDNYPITEGALNLDLNASGLFDTPNIKLDIELNNVGLADLDDIELKTNLLYNSEAKLAEASLSFSYHDEEYLNSSLYLPADLSLSEGFQIDSSENAKLELSIKEIDLSNFKELIPDIQSLKGLLAANITVEDKGTDLSPKGELSLENAAFGIKELGIIYDDVSLHLKLDENNLYLTDLKVKSDKGKLSLDGQLTHNGSFDLEKMTNLSLKVKADDFPVISTEAIDIIIDTDIEVSNTLSNPVAKGVVTIPSGKIDVDKLMANSHHSTNFDKPLLVAARETEEDDTADEEFALPLFDPASNIKAEVTLSIPKNFWIRSSDMNIELGGSIDVLINDGNIRLFGNVNTLRGFYIFYGKRFDLINGVITFSGGELLNPNLNVETVYKFRGANSRNNSLSLLVSGDLEDVEITFLLNGEQIEEGDAISYILFGRSFDELSQNEQGEVSSQSAIISNFFANKVAEQVASVVGDRLQLDLLKFSSDTTKSQFGIEVGKYLTDDLFISYKRDFSFSDSKEPVYEEIIVEYELIKNLFLQAIKGDSKASGLDLIWRMRWK